MLRQWLAGKLLFFLVVSISWSCRVVTPSLVKRYPVRGLSTGYPPLVGWLVGWFGLCLFLTSYISQNMFLVLRVELCEVLFEFVSLTARIFPPRQHGLSFFYPDVVAWPFGLVRQDESFSSQMQVQFSIGKAALCHPDCQCQWIVGRPFGCGVLRIVL